MKRPTYAELQDTVLMQSLSLSNYQQAVDGLLHGRPDAMAEHRTQHPGEKYRYRLFGARWASGGVVIVTHICRGQRDCSSVYSFLEHERKVRELPYDYSTTPVKNAMAKLMAEWRQIQEHIIALNLPDKALTELKLRGVDNRG